MRIAVVGAGGVGGYFGGRLAKAGVDTTFIARGTTLEALRTRGLRVDSINGDFFLDRVNATDDPSLAGVVDAILMASSRGRFGKRHRSSGRCSAMSWKASRPSSTRRSAPSCASRARAASPCR